jgi:hypothetical protein
MRDRDERVQFQIQILDPAQTMFGEVNGGQLPSANGLSGLAQSQLVYGGHGDSLYAKMEKQVKYTQASVKPRSPSCCLTGKHLAHYPCILPCG